jgi:DinB superfamily
MAWTRNIGTLAEATGSRSRSAELFAATRGHAAPHASREQLAALLTQIHGATRDAKMLVLGRTQADLTQHPGPDSWSVAECFDHLAQTTRAFLPAISNAIASAPNLTTSRPLRTGTLARLFIWNLEPPSRLRFKVIAEIAPRHQDFETAWSGFLESQSQLAEAMHSAAGLAIDQVRVKAPVYARITYNVYGAFRMLAAHQRRHLWQTEKILKALELGQVGTSK